MDDHSKKKPVKKVVSGPVARRKKKASADWTDSAKSAWDYVLMEVLLPAARDMLYDGVVAGSGKMIYQEDSPRPTRGGTFGTPKTTRTAYNRFAKKDRPINEPDEPMRISKRARAQHNFEEIILSSRKEAEDVLDSLFEHLLEYEVATVSDLYDMVGITPQYTDDNWGWTDVRGSGIRRIRGGYILELPQPSALD